VSVQGAKGTDIPAKYNEKSVLRAEVVAGKNELIFNLTD
jgi:hypothetical protein